MNDDEKVAHHELAHKAMSDTIQYVERGRHLRGLESSDLELEFVSSIRLVARDGDDNVARLAMNDSLAEFDLRGLEPPFHLVRHEIGVMAERGRARIAALTAEDLQDLEDQIQARYADAGKKIQ